MQETQYLVFYLRSVEALFAPQALENFLLGIARQGFYITANTPMKPTFVGSFAETEKIQKLPEMAHKALEEFVAQRTPDPRYFTLHATPAISTLPGFSCDLGINVKEATLTFEFDENYFARKVDRDATYTTWLNLLQFTYNYWHPFYGYQYNPDTFETGEDLALVSREEAEALNIHYLYKVNFFGPEIVQKFGQEKIEHTPAHRVIALEDGGFLIITSQYFLPNSTRFYDEDVAEYLGISRYFGSNQDEEEEE